MLKWRTRHISSVARRYAINLLAALGLLVLVATLAPVVGSLLSLPKSFAVFASQRSDHLGSLVPHFGGILAVCMRGIVVAAFSVAIAVSIADVVTMSRRRSDNWLYALLVLPFLISEPLRAFSWSLVLRPSGVFATCLISLGLPSGVRYNEVAVTFVLLISVLPVSLFCVLAALKRAPDTAWASLREIGSTGPARRQAVTSAAARGAFFAAILSALLAATSSAEEQHLGNSTSLAKVLSSVQGQLVAGYPELVISFGFMCWLIVLLASATVAIPAFWLLRRMGNIASQDWPAISYSRSLVLLRLRNLLSRGRDMVARVGRLTLIVIIGLGTGITIAGPLWFAFVGIEKTPFRERLLSALRAEAEIAGITNSLILGICSAAASIAAFVFLFAFLRHRRIFVAFAVAAYVPALFPPDAFALTLLDIWKKSGLTMGGWFLAFLGATAWVLPFVLGGLWLRVRALGTSCLMAADELRWSFSGRLLLIARGGLLMALCWASAFAVILSMNEFSRSRYLVGAMPLLPRVVWGRLDGGLAGADHVLLVAVSISVIAIFLMASIGALRLFDFSFMSRGYKPLAS